ncbi:hypothetical protein BOTBODRAFT_192202 [Botryobasidium botryosum FD-172 SS1]|uniref:Hemerythrin-like domain-containing protein n=1 Tax=Botryobasidium botryosum (strain FD-172 SS1) TaxID=930990 RepID=A0A067LZD0_BOTB1|nr:hypothetical protein BOTBODRAFT_192202 [Botryobasidium botryosum FD-172 SS1]
MSTTSNLDVTQEIKLDHDNVRDLWTRFQAASARDEKSAIANTLIREMAIHSDAEEISVYNDYERLGLSGTAEQNKEEHAEVKKLVYEADSASTKSADYDSILGKAVQAFLAHAQEEEDEQHNILRAHLTPEENDKIARAFLKARKKVPSRPHPSAPQTGQAAQKAAGMFGSVHDKIIETIGGRDFVELKYNHPESV